MAEVGQLLRFVFCKSELMAQNLLIDQAEMKKETG